LCNHGLCHTAMHSPRSCPCLMLSCAMRCIVYKSVTRSCP
jgi:hypothetical protein